VRQTRRQKRISSGAGQLTLVEHSLCPLDARTSLQPGLVHTTAFDFTDRGRRRRSGRATVLCPRGLAAADELFLWGLLALTLADPESVGELYATRHFLLRQLGIIDTGSRRGGRQYDRMTDALRRLACVQYENDSFYDPIRAEHRRVSFGFFSYSLPLDPESSRAWRIVWDPVFFEIAGAAGGALRFDLAVYRRLDPASRRMYLFLSKLFARSDHTHPVDLDRLAIDVLGFSPSLIARDRKAKVKRCVAQLVQLGLLRNDATAFVRRGVGRYAVTLHKGDGWPRRPPKRPIESPLAEPLHELGFETPAVGRLLRQFPTRLLREWIDITLAARERFGPSFFKKSPAAYLTDNLKHAKTGNRTPPDWWLDLRKAEEHARAERSRAGRERSSSQDSLPTKAIESIDQLQRSIFRQFEAAGQSNGRARENERQFQRAIRRRDR